MTNQDQLLYLNGLNATTGQPLIDPVSSEALTQQILTLYSSEQRLEEEETYHLRHFRDFKEYEHDLDKPQKVGWGLVLHAGAQDAIKDALAPLIEHRNGRIFTYQGESAREWKAKYHADVVNPEHFPYYVLIAGSPAQIPYELQFSLGVLRAVGRIDFDQHEDYARYVSNIIAHETGKLPRPGKRVVFFAPRHTGDYPTDQSNRHLVRPLREELARSVAKDVTFVNLSAHDATKPNLLQALSPNTSGNTPAILFSATHGACLEVSNPYQRTLQGSLVCQNYTPPLTPQQRLGFISGYDVEQGFHLPGGIHFLFACYGAGTRTRSDFANYLPTQAARKRLRDTQGKEDFVAHLPKALLADPKGGALAIVGHVDPAWVHAFISPETQQRRIDPFGFTLARLLREKPIGYALRKFPEKYADTSIDLLSIIEDKELDGISPDPTYFSSLWVCRNDAQNHIILGDPAIHLKFSSS